ncbi:MULTISPECIES: RES family NAD+ phosphorylase [unclassified Variovorax]|uniref:RES family NAD+ phosphorylase n=1 Tax=unclassified Variovorax TaxID=663243 RepID=UPI003F48BF32
MNFKNFELPYVELPLQEPWYRIQRTHALPVSARVNGFILAPAGTLDGRFDLIDDVTAYLADTEETALYETRFRRELMACSLSQLRGYSAVCFKSERRLRLVDLRGMAEKFPGLQSPRHESTQALASECRNAALDGIIYSSAQHPQHVCICLFRQGMPKMKMQSSNPLVEPSTNALRPAVLRAAKGSLLPWVP